MSEAAHSLDFASRKRFWLRDTADIPNHEHPEAFPSIG